jgi:hypothetical protein
MAHRVLNHVDITSVAFLILSDLLALAGAQANACSVYRRLPAKTGLQDRGEISSALGGTYTGSTLPSASRPRPVPSFQPIILNSLFPTLLSSCPGFTGGGGGVGGRVGPSAVRLCLRLSSTPSGNGTSGWLCMTRRSEARSRYFGVEAPALFASAAAWAAFTFPRATSRRFGSLKFRFYILALWFTKSAQR